MRLHLQISKIKKQKQKNDVTNKTIIGSIDNHNFMYKSSVLEEMIDSYKTILISQESDFERKNQIQNMEIKILCSEGSPFFFINKTIYTDYIEKGNSPIHMVFTVGRDRADFLDTVVNYFKEKYYVHSIDGIILERQGMKEAMTITNVNDIQISAYSATMIRNLVKKQNEIREY